MWCRHCRLLSIGAKGVCFICCPRATGIIDLCTLRMGKKVTLRPMGLKDLEKILSVAVVIGEGAEECFRAGGAGELYHVSFKAICTNNRNSTCK